MKDSAIGVFDSGVGGLTSVGELRRILPHENIIFLGDTARLPYGTKSPDTVHRYALEDARFLQERDVKMIIVACGTVSSVMMTKPVFDGSLPYTGVVYPAVAAAVKKTKCKRIGVIGTSATIKSGAYEQAIKDIDDSITVVTKACPMFVPLVENGYTDYGNKVTVSIVEDYLSVMKQEGVDALIMGCTHYPHLSEFFRDYLGDSVELISSGGEAAKFARRVLEAKDLLSDRTEEGKTELYCTDSVELFSENVETFLGESKNLSISKCVLK
ncbi:MAG: glutamate racemase [Ruminococcus sp.]|nr:glutamate racemase [Ruminococcus sp.]